MVLGLALAFYAAGLEEIFFAENEFASPDVSLGPIVLYFFGVIVLLAVILFFIPLRWLRLVFRALFGFMFGYGVLIVTALTWPIYVAGPLAVIAAVVWLFWARIWLHDLLLLVALAGAGSVFGFLFSPWTFMIFMLIIAVYDVVAVRFGFMVWMADKMSESDTLPAFIFPKHPADWLLKMTSVRFGELRAKESAKREYSVLGGGDIGFPLMLAVSVFFATGLGNAVIVGAFALVGLMGAFLVQLLWLKDKPVPALPPIAFASLVGFLIVEYAL